MLNDPTLRGRPRSPVSPPSGVTGVARALVGPQLGAQAMLTGLQSNPPQAINPYTFRVYLAANSALVTSNTTITIPFDTVDFDDAGRWNPATHRYTFPVSGVWYAQGNVNVNTTGHQLDSLLLTFFLVQRRAGVIQRNAQHNTAAGSNVPGSAGVMQVGYDAGTGQAYKVLAGDTLEARAFMFNLNGFSYPLTGDTTVGVGGEYTYLSAHLLRTLG